MSESRNIFTAITCVLCNRPFSEHKGVMRACPANSELGKLVEVARSIFTRHQQHNPHHEEKGIRIMAKGTFTVTFTVEPAPAPPLAVASPEDLGVVGTPLPAAVAISGGVPPYSVTNVQGTVPPGVSIGPDGSLSGATTTAGSFDVTFDVADSVG